jgi:hypothetical protein
MTTTDSFEALREYLQLREQLGELEAREHECTCDLNEFHTCDLCKESVAKRQRSRYLMELWGEGWAVTLGMFAKLEDVKRMDEVVRSEFAGRRALDHAGEVHRELLAEADAVARAIAVGRQWKETLWHIFLMLSFVLVCGCGALGVLKFAEILDAELTRQCRDHQMYWSPGQEDPE